MAIFTHSLYYKSSLCCIILCTLIAKLIRLITGLLHLEFIAGYHGTLRLTGGRIPEEGRVEVCMNGEWGHVCNSRLDYRNAFVVCRQLGYPATGQNSFWALAMHILLFVYNFAAVAVCWGAGGVGD